MLYLLGRQKEGSKLVLISKNQLANLQKNDPVTRKIYTHLTLC
jgi:hypothetical protein